MNAAVLKTAESVTPAPGVRIPPPPLGQFYELPRRICASSPVEQAPREFVELSRCWRFAATVPDDRLPVKQFSALLDRVAKTLKTSPNDIRYTMNGFVISCGTYIAALGDKAIATARKLGRVEVELVGGCKLPEAESYIMKCRRGAPVAPKRKTVRC